MALTPASVLADYSSGIGTQGATLKVNTSDKRVGIGTTNPQGTLQVGTGITMGSGIITATAADFSGNVTVGGELTYEDVTNVDSQGIGTFRQGVNVVGHSELDNINVSGVSTFSGRIVASATNNTIPFLYDNLGELPSPSTYHGAFAHVHATGKAYFAHAGAWVELVSVGAAVTSGNVLVGTGITMYTNSGIVSATAFYGDGSKLTGVAAAGSGGGALDITSSLFI